MPDPFATIHYQRNFLKEVIVRVDFLNPLPGVDVALPPPIAEIAIRDFPIPEPREALRRQVQIGPEGIASTEERFKEFQFHGIERTKTFTIGRQVALVQYKMYQTYELVKAEFVRILDRVGEVFEGVQSSRVGLRYVNTIELTEQNPTDWSAYIAPQLLSLFEFPPEVERPALSRVLNNLELSLDAFNLVYRLGMHNPDYPARIRQKVFVLDLDANTQSLVNITDVGHLLDDFHGAIQRYFEQSITDNLRRVMNGI